MSSKAPDKPDGNQEQTLPALSEQGGEVTDIAELLESLPEEKRGQLIEILEQTVSHQGWLPPPQMLREYDQVLSGLAERIVLLPEREQLHRHHYLDRDADRNFQLQARGQILALFAMTMLLIFATYLAWMGSVTAAASVAAATIVGVVGIFVTGKVVDAKARREDED